ncbi:hypothetical protein FRC12_013632 [Ceratobasidium sp. 428]|nr:hypothetical protein FRC12_013632 [Ceratobasidium sp. 428]
METSYSTETEPPLPPPPVATLARPLSSEASVVSDGDVDSFFDFADALDTPPPTLEDKDMNTNEHARHRRELLDLVNRLRAMGLAAELELPQIACIGSQSVGKSSLIESISGIALPRATGTCTRCPIECRLKHSDAEWTANVLLRFESGKDGYTGPTKEIPFGKWCFPTQRHSAKLSILLGTALTSRDEVQERIRRAQLAILNPTIGSLSFLTSDENAQYRSRSFSQNCVIVELSGNQLSDLNFVDLPGIIANVSDDRNIGDIQLVEKLVTSYISRPSCLILLTISCENDFENQGAGRLARKHDPNGRRTIGVLTKPDRIEPDSEAPWISMIRGESNALRHGWFSVKQPSARQIDAGLSWEEARALDRQFFEDTSPWSTIDTAFRHRLGCANLIAHLGETLGKVILTRLPHICNEVDRLIDLNSKALATIPARSSLDPLAEVLQLITEFTRDVSRHVRGDSSSGRAGLVQALIASAKGFQDRLRGITPVFKPVSKDSSENGWTKTPDFLPKGETWPSRSELGLTYWLEDVVELAEGYVTESCEFPFAVKEELIVRTINSWHEPVEEMFDRAQKIFFERLTTLVDKHFRNHTYGGLRAAVMKIVVEKLEELKEATNQELKFLLKMESLPFTLNSHYYLDYRDKFLAHYKFYQGEQNEQIRRLRNPPSNTSSFPQQGQNAFAFTAQREQPVDHVEEALKNLRLAGLHGLKREDIVKLLPADFSQEAALEIMASVRAYYQGLFEPRSFQPLFTHSYGPQVAYKRFADNIPLAIDQRFIHAFDETISVTLVAGLSISAQDARERCAAWLAESQAVVRQRAELLDRKSRLTEAKKELLEIPGVSAMRDAMSKAAKKQRTGASRRVVASDAAVTSGPSSVTHAQVVVRDSSPDNSPRFGTPAVVEEAVSEVQAPQVIRATPSASVKPVGVFSSPLRAGAQPFTFSVGRP